MHSSPDDAKPDYTKLLEQLDAIGMQVGSAYGDWLEFGLNPLPPQLDSKADELTIQFDKLTGDVYLFIKDIQQISNE